MVLRQSHASPHGDLAEGPRSAALIVILTGLFMASLDVAIVNVAAPAIRADLHLSPTSLVFVVSGYTLSYAVLLVTGARLGDDHGHRRFFIGGLCAFTGASLICGIAPSSSVLVAARVAQGAAAAAMVPQVLSIIQLQFSGSERARALGLYGTVLAAGAVAGQVAGGALVSANLLGATWRPVFLVNVPIGTGLALSARRHLPSSRGSAPRQPDYLGVLVLSSAALAIVSPLILGQQQGWPPWTYASLVVGFVLLGAMTMHLEARRRAGRHPLVDLTIFRRANVRRGLSSLLVMQVAYGGFLLALTLYLQAALGYSPLRSGLTFGPFAVGFATTSLTQARLPTQIRGVAPIVGLSTLALGYFTLGAVNGTGTWHVWPSLVLLMFTGAGFGAGFSPMIGRAATDVPPSLAPEVSGTVSTVVNLGFVVGVAALGSLYLNAGHGTARASGQAFSQATVPMAALALCSAALAAPRRRRRRAAATSIGAPADVTVAESLAADGRASTVSREHRRAQRQLIEADALLDRAT